MRVFWLGLGWMSLVLGAIGLLLPIVPTVPFLLLAAWAFAGASPKLRRWIRLHPRFGRVIRDWQDRGVVPPLAKVWAVVTMTFGVGLSAWAGIASWVVATQATICLGIAAYLVTRPSR